MLNFIANTIIWTLALYGLFEIVKSIIYMCTYTKLNPDGIYMIIAVKNQEKNIEMFLRSIFFKILYGKEDYIKNTVVIDLNSTDGTKEILENFSKDYEYIKVVNWKECKDVIDSINES